MSTSPTPPWYDSVWLGKYLAAKDIVARLAPAKAGQFQQAFDPLRTDPAFSVKRFEPLVPPEALDELRAIAATISKDRFEYHELQRFGRLVVHDYPGFAEVHARFAGLVSEYAGEAVEPAYSFFAMYTRRGTCEPHLDAPSAKWTLDICIGQSAPWPIRFSRIVPWPEQRMALDEDWDAQLKSLAGLDYEEALLDPGDAVLFSGSSQWHYREAMAGPTAKSHCDLLFLHYIPKGTAELVEPRNWARLFDVPELDAIPRIRTDELPNSSDGAVSVTRG